MRKILAVTVACVLLLTMVLPTSAMAAVDYSYIKVKLSSMGSPASVTFKVAGAYRIAEKSDVDLFPGITYTMKPDGTGQKLTYNNGAADVSVSLPATTTFVQYSNGSTSNFLYVYNPGTNYGWRYYDGNMTFIHASGTSYLQLVNTLFIETYLYGVVAYEMGDDWPAEALKSQAICSRTYAMRYIKANAGKTYHILDTSANQVYKGYPLSNGAPMQHVISAVDATRAKVIVCGTPSLLNFADGVFSASNGGQVRTASMKWGSANTYHVFKEDPYDLKNPSSPCFTYIFPIVNDTATYNSLNTSDKDKVNKMLALLKEKLPAQILAQKGITCTAATVTINGIKNAVPTALRTGMPAGSKEFTQIAVTVNVKVNGTTPAPIATVYGKNVKIANRDTTPSATDDTVFGSVSVSSGTISKSYTVKNTGDAALNINSIRISGVNAADFHVSQSSAVVAAGASLTFSVTFTPSAAGVRSAQVILSSNDAHSPYYFNVTGTGTEDGLTVYGKNVKIANRDTTPSTTDDTVFGSVPVSSGTIIKSYTVKAGNTALNINSIRLGGVNAADFRVSQSSAVVAAGASLTFTVTFTPSAAGERSAQVILSSNDAHSPYYFNVTGTGTEDSLAPPVAPKIAVADSPVQQLSGGGGMPATATSTFDITINLTYMSKASDGDWDVVGDLRTRFSSLNSLLSTTNLWLLYSTSDAKFLYVTARGYGHGVGLSQRGAQQMAKENKTYANIIDFYYNTTAKLSSITTVTLKQKTLAKIPGKSASTATYGKITATTLNIRAVASPSGTVVSTLPKNTVVEILATNGTWYKILYATKGVIGYASKIYITKTVAPVVTPTPSPTHTATNTVAPTATPTPTGSNTQSLGRVVATSLYMRSQVSTTSSIVYTLKKGDTVTILDANAGTNWYKVKYASYTGYCMCKNGTSVYIEIVGTAPTATPTPSATSTTVITPKTISAKPNVTDYLTLRTSASTASAKLGEIPKGATFTVVQVATTASWLKVTYSGKTGYVLGKYAIIGGNSAYRVCTVTNAQLNVRSGAGTNYGVIGILKSGNTVIVTANVTSSAITWYKIVVGTVTGYVDARYVRISTT